MQKRVFFFVSLLFSLTSSAQQNCRDCGVAFLKDRIFNREFNAFVLPKYEKDIKFLFHDSMIIAERHALTSHTDADSVETWKRFIIGYTFIDFRTRSFYNYRTFSDSARIVLATRQPTVGRVHGGWNFFDPPRIPDRSEELSDTLINGQIHKRLVGFFLRNGDTVHRETQYYVSEPERPVAFYGKTVVKGKRVSLLRLESRMLSGVLHYTTMDIASNNLSKDQLKIFAAWKKNALKHPIPKGNNTLYVLNSKGKFIPDRRPKYAIRN